MQQDFFRKLMDLFRICEDLENIDGLHMIFKIIKGISLYFLCLCLIHFLIGFAKMHDFVDPQWFLFLLLAVLLNSPQIFEKIFGDELMMDIIGSLECESL